jgi:RNA polymerase sigma-70 factor (ECF subfamily)
LAESSRQLSDAFVAQRDSPSEQALKREQAVILADALSQLPDHYREVLILRELKGLPMREVAEQMERTVNSVEKLWARAIVQMRGLLKDI